MTALDAAVIDVDRRAADVVAHMVRQRAVPQTVEIDISHQPGRAWTHADYLDVLYARLPLAKGMDDRERILAEINTVRLMAPDSASWREWAEWNAC